MKWRLFMHCTTRRDIPTHSSLLIHVVISEWYLGQVFKFKKEQWEIAAK